MRPLSLIPLVSVIVGSILLGPGTASGTPYWGDAEVEAYLQNPHGLTHAPVPEHLLPPTPATPQELRTAYLDMYGRIAHFLSILQVNLPGDPTDGGIREGEHLPNIIQTDNTSEAIWVWTRYYELTGDDQYHPNILKAFGYSTRYPAYNEEGGSAETIGYYRMYNCGWATRAVLKYRDVYGDNTYKTYGDSCASYIRYHTLVRFGNDFYDHLNPPVLSWALGNLYYAGTHESSQPWKDRAVQQARDKVKVWVEGEPTLLGNETWAMAGGATMWGLIDSYFLAYPESLTVWVPRYKDYMDTFSSAGDFTNAWNGWYALGHRAVGRSLLDPYECGLHAMLTDTLITEDGDGDGGIPARPEDSDTMDQSWVTNYLAFMGLSDFLGVTSTVLPAAGTDRRAIVSLTSAPNPLRAQTNISFELLHPEDIAIVIYDPAGRRIASLTSGQRGAGNYSVPWNGRNDHGEMVSSGVYLLTLRTAKKTVSQRLILNR